MNPRQAHAERLRDGEALGRDALQQLDGARRIPLRVEAIAVARRLETPDIAHHVGHVQDAVRVVQAGVKRGRRGHRLRERGLHLREHGVSARGGKRGDLEPLLPDGEAHGRRARPRERERIVVHLAHVHLGAASGPQELVADHERASVPPWTRRIVWPFAAAEQEARDLRVLVAARAHDDDLGAVDGGGQVRRRHLDGRKSLDQALTSMPPRSRMSFNRSRRGHAAACDSP